MKKNGKNNKGDNKYYFGKELDIKVVEFIDAYKCGDEKKSNYIFNVYLYKPFVKMIENIINVYKFNNLGEFNDIVNDTLSFLFTKKNRRKNAEVRFCTYDYSKGKAFGYFGWLIKNYLVQASRKKNIDKQQVSNIDDMYRIMKASNPSTENEPFILHESLLVYDDIYQTNEDNIKNKYIINKLKLFIDNNNWEGISEKRVANAFVELIDLHLNNDHCFDLCNKKILYYMFSQITGVKSRNIYISVINKIKEEYIKYLNEWVKEHDRE